MSIMSIFKRDYQSKLKQEFQKPDPKMLATKKALRNGADINVLLIEEVQKTNPDALVITNLLKNGADCNYEHTTFAGGYETQQDFSNSHDKNNEKKLGIKNSTDRRLYIEKNNLLAYPKIIITPDVKERSNAHFTYVSNEHRTYDLDGNTDGIDYSITTTPVICAAASGHTETIKLMFNAGANITKVDPTGATPADYAKKNGHTETAAFISSAIKQSADKQKTLGM
jgi:hypothetical protein